MTIKSVVLIMLSLLPHGVQAQSGDGTLSGFVYDAINGETLIGANVFIEGTQVGSTTNGNGYFVISNIPAGTHTVICSYLGYRTFRQPFTLAAQEAKTLDIRLAREIIEGEGIVVVAEELDAGEALFNRPLSRVALSAVEIHQAPHLAEADLLRTLQALPGIVPVSDYSAAPHVRGGTPDQNLYLLDGADVYNPERAFGLFSVFNADAIKQVDVLKGGFGAEYGGRLSSILDITHLDGNREEVEGTLALSLLSAKTTLQGPLGKKASLSGSLRRTYFDQTIARVVDDIPDYYFWDGHVKIFIDVNATNKLTLSGFGGRDVFDFTFNDDAADAVGLDFSWSNRTASLRWTTVLTPRLFGNLWITASRFASGFDLSQTYGFTEKNKVTDLTFKGDFEYSHAPNFSTRFGFEQKNLKVDFQQFFPDSRADISKAPRHYVAYVSSTLRPTPRWEIQAGVRQNWFASDTRFVNTAPRLSVKHRLTETASLKAAAGIYHQYLNRIPRTFISDVWTVANRFQKASSSHHYILGYEQAIARTYELNLETFYKTYDHIHAFNEAFLAAVSTDTFEDGIPVFKETRGLFHEGNGHTLGAELLFRRNKGPVTGWAGASFSQTRNTFDTLNRGSAFAPRHDKTWTVNLVSNLDLKNAFRVLRGRPQAQDKTRWLFGVNFVYASGQPITRPGSGYVIGSLPDFRGVRNILDGEVQEFALYPTEINAFRLPAYVRLDLSLRYQKQYRGWSMESFLQVFNVGNRKNVWFVQFEDESEGFIVAQRVDTFPMLPILPTLGIQFKF